MEQSRHVFASKLAFAGEKTTLKILVKVTNEIPRKLQKDKQKITLRQVPQKNTFSGQFNFQDQDNDIVTDKVKIL